MLQDGCRHARLWSAVVLAVVLLVRGAYAGDVAISQVYVNGGAATANWRNDYVELHNRSAGLVSLAGWSFQYAANNGTTWSRTNLTAVSLAPGQFYLIQLSAGAGGGTNPLPPPDATGTTNIGNGKFALMRTATTIASGVSCPVTDPNVAAELEDFVGLGSSNCFEGSAAAPANPNGSTATFRLEIAQGCTDTDQNGSDFTTGAADPRNTASPLFACDAGACCFGVNCGLASAAGCSGGVFFGAGSTCAPDPCRRGGCCLASGACLVTDQADCESQGGVVYLGDATTCAPDACTRGACCYDGDCYFYPREWCSASPPGRYNGDGVVCEALEPSCALGACCRADGTCNYSLEQDCLGVGVFMGLNATCTPALCAPAGACCSGPSGDLCEIRFAANCMLSSGEVYRGDGATCTPGQCPNTTGACCLSDESCVQASVGNCTGALNGAHQGAGVACAISLCASDPVGACCRPAICEITTQSLCASVGGTFTPNQASCAANPCGAPLGACCLGINCSILSASACGANPFLGAGSSCAPDPCGTGACCTPAGACSLTDGAACAGAGSVYLGNGSTCTPGGCADIGACCFDSQCFLEPAVRCQNLNGDPRGAGTGCTPVNDCQTVIFRACCETDVCRLWDADTCVALGGTFLPNQTTCDANPCGAPLGACCSIASNTCTIGSAAFCAPGGGGGPRVFHGPGTSCVSSPCGDPGLGACCIASACTTRIASACTSAGGMFLGAGAGCEANTCLVVGACCLPDGACVEFTSTACAAASGVYSGDGATCTAGLCPRGCCLPDQSCVFVTATTCAGLGGASRPGACSTTFCFVTCCAPDGTCTLVSDAACIASGGVREGRNACGPSNCFGACCVSGSGACLIRGKGDCGSLGYRYLGYQTPCQPTTCTGACCMPGTLTCTLEFRVDCLAMGGLFVGFEVACGPTACPGACCVSTGCTTVTQSQCAALGGTYRFHGASCLGACEGACCDSAGGCALTLPSACGSGSTFLGAGTVCDAGSCTGACCTDSGCTPATPATCAGSFVGIGAACTPSPCGGACCVRDAAPFCRILPPSECTPASGGIYLGDGSTCGPSSCRGACCFDPAVDGVPLVCQEVNLGLCYGQNGQFRGIGTTCQSPPGSGNWVQCCAVNVNMIGGVTVQDLFDFMALYFAANPVADINGSGTISVQDIFDFLAGFFFSCS